MTVHLKTYILEHWQDESSIDDDKRKILLELKKAYPRFLTTKELIDKTEAPESTIYKKTRELEKHNFIKEIETRKRRRGRHSGSDSIHDKRLDKFVIENANYLNYSKDLYRLAPGNVEYPSKFQNLCDRLLDEDEDADDLLGSLLHLVERIQNRMRESNDVETKLWAPSSDINHVCQMCGINHEARDFVRASLLRLIDRFETSLHYLEFMKNNQYLSQEFYQEGLKLTRSSKEGSRLDFDQKHKESGTGWTFLRILSIEKDTGKNQILFLGINEDGKFLHGTIDKELVTDAMLPDAMIKCLTNDIVMDTTVGSYIGLSKDDSFVEIISDDPHFPTVSQLILKISEIQSLELKEEESEDCILEGVIIQKPEELEIVYPNHPNIPATRVLLGDNTGRIYLDSRFDTVLKRLSVGDKIRVVGALISHVRTMLDPCSVGS
jgi:hypothetical protein